MLPLNPKAERKSKFHSKFYRMNETQLQEYINKLRDVLVSLPDHDITVRVYNLDQDFYETSLKISICVNDANEIYLIKHLDRRNEIVNGADAITFLGSHYVAYTKNQIEGRKQNLNKLLVKN